MASQSTTSSKDAGIVKQIVRHFNLAYFAFDPIANRFTYLHDAIAQLSGVSLDKIRQSPALLVTAIHPEDREFVRQQYSKLKEGIGLQNVEFRTVLPNEQVLWISVAATMIRDEAGGTFIGGYAEDITDLKEYLHNLLKFNAKKNSTLEILSHDLAAPFGNIEGISSILKKQIGTRAEDGPLQKLLDLIEEDARKGSTMISDFVNNEFLESSQVVLNKERVDLVDKIRVMVDNYQRREDLVSKHFILQVPDSPVFIYLDAMKFMQVLNNLFSNAIKFTTDQGKIAVSLEEKASSVLLTVTDNGVGIPEELQPYLFDKFTKARREGIRGEQTVGMGMSIIKTIVELHSGSIWFESRENVGTTFYIELPKE